MEYIKFKKRVESLLFIYTILYHAANMRITVEY